MSIISQGNAPLVFASSRCTNESGSAMGMPPFESESPSFSNMLSGTPTKASYASLVPSSKSTYASSSRATSHRITSPFKYSGVFLCSRHRALCTTTNFSTLLEVSLFLLIEWMKLYVDQFLSAAKEQAI